jgi:hypothetical protein
MKFIKSAWKITLDPAGTPAVVLAFGDRLEDEPAFESKRGHEVIEVIDSLTAFIRDKKAVTGSIRYTRFKDESTDAIARGAVITNLMSGLAKGKTTARIDIQGDATRYFLAAQAIVTSTSPKMQLHPGSARHGQSYQLTFTGLSEVAIPPPPP